MDPEAECDIAVIGAGPAGLAAARACRRQDLSVRVFGADAPWPNTYGVWHEELVGLPESVAGWVWPRAEVRLAPGDSLVLPRAYARIDNAALRRALLRTSGGADLVADQVRRVEHRPWGSVVHTDAGHRHRVRLVIDATGHAARFTVGAAPGRTLQVAYGLHVRVDGHPFPLDRIQLMDWSSAPCAVPTFLYAMPLGTDELFVEETSLMARPGVPLPVLQRGLARRLAALGIEVREVLAIERCRLPMDPALPPPQRTVAFGGAAALVHPATGYQLGAALHAAPILARAIANHLDRGPDRAAAAAWHVLWSPERVRSRGLFLFGAEVLRGLDLQGLRRFFRSFFALPVEAWAGFLSGQASPDQVVRAMARLFVVADPRTRWTLLGAGLGRPIPLFRSVTGL